MTTRCQREDCPPPATAQEVAEASALGDLENVTATATFDLPEGYSAVYIQGHNGAWRQIGTADPSQFASLHAEPPETGEVSGGPTAYARRDIEWSPGQVLADGDSMSFTVTFEFDPATVDIDSLPAPYGVRRQATYLEETPEGDIVERIDWALQDWERGYPYSDAYRSSGVDEDGGSDPGPVIQSWAPSSCVIARDHPSTDWIDVEAIREEEDEHIERDLFRAATIERDDFSEMPYRGDLAASLRYIRECYDRRCARGDTVPYYGFARLSAETRGRIRRAWEQWGAMRARSSGGDDHGS